MILKKGQKLHINHSRKGRFFAIVIADFNPEFDDFNVEVAPGNGQVFGNQSTWDEGDKIPCRKSLIRTFKVLD